MVNKQSQAYLFAGLAVFFWSTVATAFKLSLRYIDVLPLLLIASLTSSIVLIVIMAIQGKLASLKILTMTDYIRLGILGLLNPVVYYLVLFHAYDLLPAQVAMAVNYSWGITLMLLSVPILGHKVTRIDCLATVFCYAGVLVISFVSFSGPSDYSMTGLMLALASTVIWAFYWLLKTKDQIDPIIGLFVSFAASIPVLLVLNLFFAGEAAFHRYGILGGIYIGLFEMGITFALWLTALKLTEQTARISTFIFITPFLSLVYIYFVLGESIRINTLFGLALIITGLWVQQQFRKKESSESQESF